MGFYWSYGAWFTILLIPVLGLVLSRLKPRSRRIPPGPPGWPILGNIFDLGAVPHITIAAMRPKYGPVVWLEIGYAKTMVILSAKLAAEFFKNHDVSFADRKINDVSMVHNLSNTLLSIAPYGTYWRVLKRICTVEMFTTKRINETVHARRKCVDAMLQWIGKEDNSMKKGSGIELARFVFLASFNIMGNLLLSRDVVDPESKKASEFFTAMKRIMEVSGSPNISDLLPFLRWLDLQGLRRKMDQDMGKVIEVASTFVKERMIEYTEGRKSTKDFFEVLLEFEGRGKDEPDKLSEYQITMFITEMFLGGSETTSTTVEWAFTELLRNPESMTRVKAEISKVVGNRKFEESDIDNLHYMQAVVKETLRLHPPLPLLIPRRAIHDTSFMGHDIPKDTQVYINVWAVGRDSECWEDPLEFKPERFLTSEVNFKGQNFEFIPFGAGRRICAGLSLGNRMLHVFLGSLLHEFDWELPSNVTYKTMDMKEKIGMTARKLQPLQVVPIKRTLFT